MTPDETARLRVGLAVDLATGACDQLPAIREARIREARDLLDAALSDLQRATFEAVLVPVLSLPQNPHLGVDPGSEES